MQFNKRLSTCIAVIISLQFVENGKNYQKKGLYRGDLPFFILFQQHFSPIKMTEGWVSNITPFIIEKIPLYKGNGNLNYQLRRPVHHPRSYQDTWSLRKAKKFSFIGVRFQGRKFSFWEHDSPIKWNASFTN